MTDALNYLLDNIYIRFGSKLYRQNVGIQMGTNCVPYVADLFLFCYERDFMKALTKEKRYDLIDALNSTSRYLDDLLNIDNIHFEHMVHRIYSAELQLNKANASDTEAALLDLNLFACLVINPITVGGYAPLFNCPPVDRASDSIMPRPKAIHFSWLGQELSSVAWSTGVQLIIFFCFRFSVVLLADQGSPSVMQQIVSVESSSLLLHSCY